LSADTSPRLVSAWFALFVAALLAFGVAHAFGGLVAAAQADDNGGSGGHDGGSGGGGGGGGGSGGGGGGSSGGGGGGGSGGDGSSSGSDDGGTTAGSGAEDKGQSGGNGDAGGAGGGRGDRYEAGEVVILADRPDLLAKAREMGFRLIGEQHLASLDLSILRLGTPTHVDERLALAMLRAAFPGLTADVNSLYAPYSAQSAQVVSLPQPDYARRMIGWRASESCGAGIRIGMIDMAPGPSPALSGQKLHLQSFLDPGKQAFDNGHGTAIASLLIGHGVAGHTEAAGLLPAADLYAAAVFTREADRSEASAFAIAGALDWMAANQVRVVNISLSGGANSLLDIAVQRATAKGSVLVAAAGNGGPAAPPAFPAALPEVIAVTAVDQEGSVYAGANRGDYIAFSAPGVGIWAPVPDALGQYLTGTSVAAPFMTAAAALELTNGVPGKAAEITRRLAARAMDLGQAGKDPVFGYGLVRAAPVCGTAVSAP
jgi:subtilisin family serine protease